MAAAQFESAASVRNGLKQIIFFGAFPIFESGGIRKHLMTGPSGNSEFCFPSTSMSSSASPQGTLRVSGKQNSLFPLWPVIKCLVMLVLFNDFHEFSAIHYYRDRFVSNQYITIVIKFLFVYANL